MSLKHLCFNQSFHCHNFSFFLSHCTSACTICVLFIILITDSVYFIIFIIISTTTFSVLVAHNSCFLCTFFLQSFAVFKQLVFPSVVFSLSFFFLLYPDLVISITCKGKNHLNLNLTHPALFVLGP